MGKFWVIKDGKRKRTAAGVKHEYEKFQSSAKARAERSSRTTARRRANASGRTHKGDGKELDHINSNPMDNRSSNLRVISRSANRSKTENSRKRGSGRNRQKWGK